MNALGRILKLTLRKRINEFLYFHRWIYFLENERNLRWRGIVAFLNLNFLWVINASLMNTIEQGRGWPRFAKKIIQTIPSWFADFKVSFFFFFPFFWEKTRSKFAVSKCSEITRIKWDVYVQFLNSLTYILATREHEFCRKEREREEEGCESNAHPFSSS